jgi:hypothetical protein
MIGVHAAGRRAPAQRWLSRCGQRDSLGGTRIAWSAGGDLGKGKLAGGPRVGESGRWAIGWSAR